MLYKSSGTDCFNKYWTSVRQKRVYTVGSEGLAGRVAPHEMPNKAENVNREEKQRKSTAIFKNTFKTHLENSEMPTKRISQKRKNKKNGKEKKRRKQENQREREREKTKQC